MKLALISNKQLKQLWREQLSDNWTFNPVVDKWGNLIISEEEILAITNPAFDWVKDLPLYQRADIQKNLDTTPPAGNGTKIVIPNKFKWLFPFKLNGFVIDITTINTTDYIEHSVLGWTDFWFEMNKPQNEDIEKIIKPFINHINDVANHV